MGIIVPSATHIAPELPVEPHTHSPRNRMEGDLNRILDGSLPIHPRRTLDQFLLLFFVKHRNAEIRIKPSLSGPDPTLGEEGRSKAAGRQSIDYG